MTDTPKLIADLVRANGGALVGKTRLQKTFYLLERCGLESGIDFDYYHYGPYSHDVSQAARWAELEGLMSEEEKTTFSGDAYSIFHSRSECDDTIGKLSIADARSILSLLRKYNSIELELAATVDYLRNNGYEHSAIEETRARKPNKANEARMQRALELLERLELIETRMQV